MWNCGCHFLVAKTSRTSHAMMNLVPFLWHTVHHGCLFEIYTNVVSIELDHAWSVDSNNSQFENKIILGSGSHSHYFDCTVRRPKFNYR